MHLNIKKSKSSIMGESARSCMHIPGDLLEHGEDRALTRGLMRLSERVLAQLLGNEPDLRGRGSESKI